VSDAGTEVVSESKSVPPHESRTALAARKLRESRTGKTSIPTPGTKTTGNQVPRSGKERAAEAKKKIVTKTQSFVSPRGGKAGANSALKGMSAKDLLSTPLFELATLTAKEKQVNLQKLKTFLATNGEYPTRYRPLIWRFLLKLPENTQAFTDLGTF
jgi:hypothetical protein